MFDGDDMISQIPQLRYCVKRQRGFHSNYKLGMDSIGERISGERRAQKMSQKELARRVRRLGGELTQSGVTTIETRGNTRPRYTYEIAKALSVDEGWLITGRGAKERDSSALDGKLLAEIFEAMEKAIIDEGLIVNPEKKAEALIELYKYFEEDEEASNADRSQQVKAVIRFAAKTQFGA